MESRRRRSHGMPRSAGYASSTALLVPMMAALLTACGSASLPARSTTSRTTPTATLAARRWIAVPTLANLAGDPVIAPSDPRVVYVAHPQTSKGGPAAIVLRRTDDAGMTWRTLPFPGTMPATLYFLRVFVDPADAHSVFVTVAGSDGDAQYHSADEGEHWQALTLPPGGWLGGFLPSGTFSVALTVRAQGNRLYSMLGAVEASSGGRTPGGRLVVSSDGGTRWQLADAGLAAAGQSIWDYMPAPSGATGFAVTQPAQWSGLPSAMPPLRLWRSDDAGDHWILVGGLPDDIDNGMLVAVRPGASDLVLYVSLLTSSKARILRASTDGGRTWSTAPDLPEVGTWPGPNPVGTLADGSAIMAYTVAPEVSQVILYAWKAGDAAWRAITAPVGAMSLVVTPQGPAGPTMV